MDKKLKQHIDHIFEPYNGLKPVEELKQELFRDLQETIRDLQNEGFSDDDSYTMAIASIGDISEIIATINAKTEELRNVGRMNFSMSDLKSSDLSAIAAHERHFDYSDLKGSNFEKSDLQKSSFKASNLADCNFNGANLTGSRFNKSNLRGSTFDGADLTDVDFRHSELSGISFDRQTLTGTSFDYCGLKKTSFRNAVLKGVSFRTDVRKTSFDGATMDKMTYAVLKGYRADLTNVRVI